MFSCHSNVSAWEWNDRNAGPLGTSTPAGGRTTNPSSTIRAERVLTGRGQPSLSTTVSTGGPRRSIAPAARSAHAGGGAVFHDPEDVPVGAGSDGGAVVPSGARHSSGGGAPSPPGPPPPPGRGGNPPTPGPQPAPPAPAQ